MLEACRLNVSKTELAYDAPSANETLGSGSDLMRRKRLRSALAAVRIHSNELIGKMCRYTSGEAVGAEAIKKRFKRRD